MKTSAAYRNQVELMRKCNLFFEHNGSDYLVSQIVIRKNGQDTIYRVYGTCVTASDPVSHCQEVPGDYNLKVKRIIQKHDLYRYFLLVAAPALSYLAIYLWRPIFKYGQFDVTSLVPPMIVTILAIICWQMVRELWL
jgi:hypothetical protein